MLVVLVRSVQPCQSPGDTLSCLSPSRSFWHPSREWAVPKDGSWVPSCSACSSPSVCN